MATSQAVWGLEIGRAALKALRCRLDGDSIVADAFDFIEYPKLLSQPDAEVPTLIREALNQFLSRNNVRGDKVAIAVSGESGLAKYFKPPPVDRSKIPDIVKYEAKQQIPFALDDVIWDYQLMAGYRETDGFVMDSEIGLFAMKREQVFKALQPYRDAGIEVDFIQLAPIAVYNYIAYDLARPKKMKEGEEFEYDPDKPPPSYVVMAMGTDTTDLVVSNGYRLWQRNIPLGGNHFTKQLSKELKLTFAKAEHLKRTPQQADDPKAIFTAMRSVFADIVTEVQRSVSFFRSLDRKADIQQLVMLGNTVKLPGLQQYVIKHLGLDSVDVSSFNRLNGSAVISAPAFKENVPSFAVCYGLCIQALGKGNLSTNLLPRELLKERMIRAKKPWAVAAVSGVLLACAINFIMNYLIWNEVHADRTDGSYKWSTADAAAKGVATTSTNLQTADKQKMEQEERLKTMAKEIAGASDRKLLWLELLYAINSALPETPELKDKNVIPTPEQLPFSKRRELHITSIESQFFPDLKVWFNAEVKKKHDEFVSDLASGRVAEVDPAAEAAAAANAAQAQNPMAPGTGPMPPVANPMPPVVNPMAPATGPMPPVAGPPVPAPMTPAPMPAAPATPGAQGTPVEGPTGPGWVIELHGYHYFKDGLTYGPAHVRSTLMAALEEGTVELPEESFDRDVDKAERRTFTMKELGISYPILVIDQFDRTNKIPNPNYEEPRNNPALGVLGGPEHGPGPGPMPDPAKPEKIEPQYYSVPKYTFSVQFVWQEKRLNERIKTQKEQEEANKKAAEAAAQNMSAPATGPGPAPAVPLPVTPTGAAS